MGNAASALGEPRSATGLYGRIVAEVLAAFALLTRLPVTAAGVDATGAAAFGLVGGLVGLAGAIPLVVLGQTEPLIAAVGAVALMAVFSGALHLDGLADTADALLAPDRARAEQARKDPSIGPGGVVALILVLFGQVAALASLAGAGTVPAAAACVVAGTVSRVVPVLLARLADGRTGAGGFGAWFTVRVRAQSAFLAVASVVTIVALTTFLAGSASPAIGAAAGVAVGLLAARAVVAARGQLDGDGLGASVELAMVATLVACAIATS